MNELDLMHFGVKGMKWGVRRYQNTDGSLTSAGKSRYRDISEEERKALKLPKKWKYQEPETNADAHKKILKRNLVTTATVSASQIAVKKWMEKRYGMSTPASKMVTKTAKMAGFTFVSNLIVDEAIYLTKGVVRK